MEERARMKASRDGEGAKIVGNRTLPKEVPGKKICSAKIGDCTSKKM
jgi:hypothetical protein